MINKKTKKKCKHEVKYSDPCPQCGFDEGICDKCGKWVCRDHWDDEWEEE